MSTVHGRTTRSQGKTAAHRDAECFLEIARGKTAHPMRPIPGDRFLIGSGGWCDLCLGGAQVPVLHSVIHLDGQKVWIDSVAVGPELRVNGQRTTFAELHHGDRIEIGSFSLKFHHQIQTAAKATPSPYEVIPESDLDEDEDAVDLSKLSASELVDLIESDMAFVDEFEERKRRGTEALLDAVRRHGSDEVESRGLKPQPAVAPVVQPKVPAELLKELEHALQSIGQLAKDLEERSSRLTHSEVSAAAASLLEFQEQVASRLDVVLAKISKQPKPVERGSPRRDAA